MDARKRAPALLAGAVCLLAACSGGERLTTAVAAINRDYGALQDEAVLLNVLRRSAGLPAHFTSLTVVRGRSRVTAGADLTLPFGGDAAARFEFTPHLSLEQGPSFELSTRDNQEFYRGYIAPVDTRSLDYFLRQDVPHELVLTLFVDRLRIRDGAGETEYVNSPDQPENYAAFQRQVATLVDQGLMTEPVSLARRVGPDLRFDRPPGLDQILSARKEGLTLEEAGAGRYRVVQVSDSARFCFRRPQRPLYERARCRTVAADRRRVAAGDPTFFGSTGAVASFAADDLGAIEIHTRSLAGVFDYLGELARVQRSSGRVPKIRTVAGPQPVLVVRPAAGTGPAAVATDFQGARHAIPAGPAGGQSGTVLSIVSQLLAQAQSVQDLPASNTVTIVGE